MPPPPSAGHLTRRRLLDRLSAPAPMVAVIGPRGAGKSTLLHEWFAGHADAVWVEAHLPDELPERGTLVIDDADRLSDTDTARLDDWITRTPDVRLLLAARAPLDLLARHDALVVRDLSFSRAEVIAYLAKRGSLADPREVLLATGGLPDAVRIAARAGLIGREQIERLLGRVYADDALAEEEADLAVPALLTPELVGELGGAAEFLDRAERSGRGGWIDDPLHPTFALTMPVRAATRARSALSDEQRRALRERAARSLTDQGAWAAAVVEAAASERFDLAATAIKNGGMPLLTAHGPALVALLQGIPAGELRQHPVIALALAVMYNARRQHRVGALEMFAIALVGLQTAPRSSSDRALLRALESIARRLSGVGDGGVRAARSASTMLSELATAEAEQLQALRGDLRVHLGVSLLYGGHPDEARIEFEQAATGAIRPSVELMALGGIALTHALDGAVPAARHWIAMAEARPWPAEIVDEYPGSMLRIAQARVALEDADPDAAIAWLNRIWPIIDTIEHWPLLAVVRALADIAARRPDEGLVRLRTLRAHRGARLRPARPAARMLDAAESALALAAGDLVSARKLSIHRADGPEVRLAVARVAVSEGDDERALRLIADTRPTTPDQQLTYLALSAVLLRRVGRHDESAGLVRQVDAMQRTLGLHTPILLVPGRDLFEHPYGPAAEASAPPAAPPRLTPRERIVLAELVRTASVDEVAARLHVSPNTVKTQRRTLYRKLNVTRREDAIAVAVAHRLLDDSVPTRETTAAETSTSTAASTNSAT
ncbi:LuxR C-terminal-related transcriptional regulator [Microbacterium sp. P05]|uniref:LuxR C-terminal-related transcriptional regulator n=1 Tax=Microbacterium sp. P05 TaxID=3366948 RepID=UPI00374726C2